MKLRLCSGVRDTKNLQVTLNLAREGEQERKNHEEAIADEYGIKHNRDSKASEAWRQTTSYSRIQFNRDNATEESQNIDYWDLE